MVSERWLNITILTKARSASAQQQTLIVPDKDADGLSAGVIVHRTLVTLGLDPSLLAVHLVQKGSNIHDELERHAMTETSPKYIIVVDQGSRAGLPVIDSADAKCMIIDHHLSDEFPKDAIVCYSTPSLALSTNVEPGSVRLPLSTGGNVVFNHL
jgi:single-stranded DNA-specific DHH superfamily exonuclease